MEEQFIYDLPDKLGMCIKSEDYANAVKFYTGAMPIFKVAFPCLAYIINDLITLAAFTVIHIRQYDTLG